MIWSRRNRDDFPSSWREMWRSRALCDFIVSFDIAAWAGIGGNATHHMLRAAGHVAYQFRIVQLFMGTLLVIPARAPDRRAVA
jgi:hypothetical protein